MNGDSGAAAAPATAPLDRDEAAAGAPGEEVKLDEPAALGEKQQGETAAAAAAAAAMEPQAPPEASAAPEPPARNGGPFSSTVIPRTVDAIAEDHFKRRDAILRAITDGEKKKKIEGRRNQKNNRSMGAPDGVDLLFFKKGSLCSLSPRASTMDCSCSLFWFDQRATPI